MSERPHLKTVKSVEAVRPILKDGIGKATVSTLAGAEVFAPSVLTTVIGHRAAKDWTIVDAGWMAMSRDRGTAAQAVDQGYGIVCTAAGVPIPDLVVPPDGTLLRILPNNACATAAQHGHCHVLPEEESTAKREAIA